MEEAFAERDMVERLHSIQGKIGSITVHVLINGAKENPDFEQPKDLPEVVVDGGISKGYTERLHPTWPMNQSPSTSRKSSEVLFHACPGPQQTRAIVAILPLFQVNCCFSSTMNMVRGCRS